MTDNDIVSEYWALAGQGADFDNPTLVALREQMTKAEIWSNEVGQTTFVKLALWSSSGRRRPAITSTMGLCAW
jgi:hypothetical protein